MEIELFIPCYVDQLFPQTGWSTVKLLEKCGLKVHYNPEQTCCGLPAFHSGHKELCKPVAEKWLKDFTGSNTGRHVVCPSGGCVNMVRNYYHEMFMNSSYHVKLRNVQSKTFELSEFLVDELKREDFGASLSLKAVYHDACNALRECGIREQPRRLLSKVKGLQLLESKDSAVCCGFGGAFSIQFDSISIAMAEDKVNNALALGAECIISTDLSCLMHLDGYIQRKKLPLKTMHLADVLASGWE